MPKHNTRINVGKTYRGKNNGCTFKVVKELKDRNDNGSKHFVVEFLDSLNGPEYMRTYSEVFLSHCNIEQVD